MGMKRCVWSGGDVGVGQCVVPVSSVAWLQHDECAGPRMSGVCSKPCRVPSRNMDTDPVCEFL